MYRVQNLSNRSITFQGVTIPAHGFADYGVINPYDFIALARFCNSGKARYTQFTPKDEPVEAVQPVVEEVAPTKVEEPVEVAPVEEVTESVTEPVVEETVVEDVPNEDTIPEDDIPVKPTRRTRKSKNDDSDSK